MKTVIGGIVGGVVAAAILLGVIILMPNEIEEVQEYVQVEIRENSDVQICQKVIREMLDLSAKYKNTMSLPQEKQNELQTKYMEFMVKYAECERDFPEWRNTFGPIDKYLEN